MIKKLEIEKNPFIGIFGITNEEITLLSVDFTKEKVRLVENTLSTETLLTTIARTNLLGILSAGNSNGVVLPYNVEDYEISKLKKCDIKIEILSTKFTALGNMMLCNDKGAVISKKLEKESRLIEDALDVEIFVSDSINFGSMGLCTNNGCLVHPSLSEMIDELEKALKVEVDIGSANRGVYYLGICALANTKGALVGSVSTGPEINKIEDILF
ncbi:MAG: translation initiation factor IF-6 [Methanomicrobia archaeon]|nr:translation initiation factor IF-6 [Methanomicrobia archaeon]MCK4636268.1 translation initiation factor IF-6 [Methanomicrobia archaeon]